MMKNRNTLFLVLSWLLICNTACKKEQQQPAAEEPAPVTPAPTATVTPTVDPYTYSSDLSSSKEIYLANMIMADLEMMCAYLGENVLYNAFFNQAGSTSATNTTTVIRDDTQKFLVIGFNKTTCRDGRIRDGSVFFQYKKDPTTNPNANPNANYYRDFGYVATVMTSEYKVDGWKVELFNPSAPGYISNQVSSASYNPNTENLAWKFTGKFKLTNVNDGRVIIWDGTVLKTLTNTGSTAVFAADKQSSINWTKAIISYGGSVQGSTSGTVPFNYFVDVAKPLVRDFNCSFAPANSTATDFHPFISGVATFSSSVFHPRIMNHGPASACDNSDTISFKDEVHPLSFE